MKTPSKRELVGRTIADFSLRTWKCNGCPETHHDPLITLDDGTRLMFTTEETEAGEYGVAIKRFKP